jgi:hypothetical protein
LQIANGLNEKKRISIRLFRPPRPDIAGARLATPPFHFVAGGEIPSPHPFLSFGTNINNAKPKGKFSIKKFSIGLFCVLFYSEIIHC